MSEICFVEIDSEFRGNGLSLAEFASVVRARFDLDSSLGFRTLTAASFYNQEFSDDVVLIVICGTVAIEVLAMVERIGTMDLIKHCPLWVTIDWSQSGAVSRAMEAGIDDVIPLPLSEPHLVLKLKQFLNTVPSGAFTPIRKLNRFYELCWAHASDAIMVHRFREETFSPFEEVNQKALELYGYSREEFLKLDVPSIVCPGAFSGERGEVLRQTLISEGKIEIETEHLTKDGKPFPVEVRAKLVDFEGQQFIVSSVRDITKRVEIRKELELQSAQLAMGLEVGRMACWSVDFNNGTIILNDACYALLDTTAEEQGGYELTIEFYRERFIHPEDRPMVEAEFDAVLSSCGQMMYRESTYRTPRKDGSLGFIYIRYYVNELENGEKDIFGICQDITKQKQTEYENLKIRRQQEITQMGIDLSVVPIFQLNENGQIEYVNEFACSRYGYTHEEFLRLYIWDIDPTMDPEKFKMHRDQTRLDGYRVFETLHRCKDGKVLNVEVTVRYFDFEGKKLTFSFAKDLTDQKLQQQKLEESERRFRKIVTNAPGLGMYGLHEDGTVFFWNRAATEIFGFDQEEVLGKSILDLIHLDKKPSPEVVAKMKEILKSGSNESREVVVHHKDGSEVTGLHTGVLVRINDRDEYYSLWINLNDIKQAEREKEEALRVIAAAKEQAEKANKAKDDFLAVMSHEMRTPLNSIIGFTDLSRMEPSEIDPEHLEVIHESGLRLKNLIDDILDISRIGRDAFEPDPVDFQLIDLLKSSFRQIEGNKPVLDYRLQNGFDGLHEIPLGFMVNEDPHIIGRILDNLLTNASKYTSEGFVELRIGLKRSEGSYPILRFEVEDSGIGIEQSMMSGLFEPFTQVDKSFTRRGCGVGLGLAICKRLVSMLKGNIEVHSTFGEGSVFAVEIPVRPAQTLSPGGKAQSKFKWYRFQNQPKVLIVDDTANNSKIVSVMVGKMGVESFLAVDGLDAVNQCMAQPFDLILMDLSMPNMDGIEATQRVRSVAGYNQTTPIVGLSAHVSENVQNHCLDAGMNGYLEKPISPSRLQRCLLQHLEEDAP